MAMIVLASSSALSSCVDISHVQRIDKHQAMVVAGPPATANITPMDKPLACYNSVLTGSKKVGPVRISVGTVKDYTGKISEDSGGAAVTQGAALMMISALGKLGPKIRLIERFDTDVADREFQYLNKKYLGDGREHTVPTKDGEERKVRWIPYKGGSIRASDFFIVGGITELNYNIQSGGVEVSVTNAGPMARVFVLNVAADLRIVRTATLEVMKTVTLQKQIVGYEVGAMVFQFFGSKLVDVNAGAKNQEPLQLGVRAIMELGALRLLSGIMPLSPWPCIRMAEWKPKNKGLKPIQQADPKQFRVKRKTAGTHKD